MTRSMAFPLALLAAACAGPGLPRTPHGEEVLRVEGAVKGGPFRLGKADVAALPRKMVVGVYPGSGRVVRYEGLDLWALEERVDLAEGADTIVLDTGDHRSIAVPLSVVRELRPVLSERADGDPLAGSVVAWPIVEHHGLASDPRAALWWARDVVSVRFVAWDKVYGLALHLPEGAPAGAAAGAAIFGWRCLPCHRLRGTGGTLGPELAHAGRAPSPEKLRAALADHPGWTSPGAGAPGDLGVSQLATFLHTAARVLAEEGDAGPDPPTGPPRPVLTVPR